MSDTEWRLSGGIGTVDVAPEIDDPTPQTMLQGIGFPLRPVDGVPPQASGEQFPAGTVAEGLFMQFMGNWEAGLWYPKGAVCNAGDGWTMVANKLTLDDPQPAPIAAPEYILFSFAPTTQSNLSQVRSGMTVTLVKSGWIKKLRVWVPAQSDDITYRLITVNITDPDNPVTTTYELPTLNTGAWTIVATANEVREAGNVFLIYLSALNSGADTVVTGGWLTGAVANSALPATQNWNRNTQQTIVRLSKTDLDGTDRTSELLGVVVDSTITIAQTSNPSASFTYRVTAILDEVSCVTYTVVLQATGETGPLFGQNSTININIPIALATEYSEQTNAFPPPATWATVEGYLSFDGVEQAGVETNAYGVDVQFEEGDISPDWDIMSYSTTK